MCSNCFWFFPPRKSVSINRICSNIEPDRSTILWTILSLTGCSLLLSFRFTMLCDTKVASGCTSGGLILYSLNSIPTGREVKSDISLRISWSSRLTRRIREAVLLAAWVIARMKEDRDLFCNADQLPIDLHLSRPSTTQMHCGSFCSISLSSWITSVVEAVFLH